MRGIAGFTNQTSPRFVDLPDPADPEAGQVLCRTLELGICGTDREILASAAPFTATGSEFLVLGHECLAQVELLGDDVEELNLGELVVPLVRRANDDAADRRVDLLPFGHYVERGIVTEHGFSLPQWLDEPRHLVRIEPEFAPLAVLTEPQSVAEKGANEALLLQQARLDGAWTDQPPRVLVTGLGPIAFAAVIAAVCRDWPTTVYGRDARDTFRADLVTRFGAAYLPADEARFDSLDSERHGYDLVLECTGNEGVILRCASAMASCGVMVWLGSSRRPQPDELNFARLVREALLRNQLFIGSVNAAPRDFHDAVAHLQQLQRQSPDAVAALITARVSPQDALGDFERRRPQGIKTIVVYEE